MSSRVILWDAKTWLKDNYTKTNGLPDFFVKGDYSYANKNQAEEDYRTAVKFAADSGDEKFSLWASAVIGQNFSILQNTSINNYWAGLLISQNREGSLSSHEELIFKHSSSSSFLQSTSAPRKRSLLQETNSFPRPPIQQHVPQEEDVTIQGLDFSLPTFVANLAHSSTISDRKTRYFVTIGMNGIIDTTDETVNGQLINLDSDSRNVLKERFKYSSITVDVTAVKQFEEYVAITERDYKTYLKRCISSIRYSKLQDKYDIISDFYSIILKLHLYSPEVFDDEVNTRFSEADLVVKVWCNLFETIFRGSGTTLHWGDTISPDVLATGTKIRMDLRIIKDFFSSSKAAEVGSAEISKFETDSKYYRDLLKVVLASKIHLSNIIQGLNNEDAKGIIMPFCIISGLNCYVYALRFVDKQLFALIDINCMTIPSSLKELRNGGILGLISIFFTLKELCLDVSARIMEREDFLRLKKRKVIKKNESRFDVAAVEDRVDLKKPLWLPPCFRDDGNDDL